MVDTIQFSAVPRVLGLWKESLRAAGKSRTADALADPTEYEDMFPDLQFALEAEEAIKSNRTVPVPAFAYSQWKELSERDIITGKKFVLGLMLLQDTSNCF